MQRKETMQISSKDGQSSMHQTQSGFGGQAKSSQFGDSFEDRDMSESNNQSAMYKSHLRRFYAKQDPTSMTNAEATFKGPPESESDVTESMASESQTDTVSVTNSQYTN
jgi:hypothetical protein